MPWRISGKRLRIQKGRGGAVFGSLHSVRGYGDSREKGPSTRLDRLRSVREFREAVYAYEGGERKQEGGTAREEVNVWKKMKDGRSHDHNRDKPAKYFEYLP